MSLTRAQWEEMWKSVKAIENYALQIESKTVWDSRGQVIRSKCDLILNEVREMKEQIQSVIGQME
jgi:hypothetical protein